MRLLPPVMCVLLLLGCADTHRITRADGSKVAVSLQRQASAYVAVPESIPFFVENGEATPHVSHATLACSAISVAASRWSAARRSGRCR